MASLPDFPGQAGRRRRLVFGLGTESVKLIDWAGYRRVHADRRNLIVHLIAVPLFAASFLALLVFSMRADYMSAAIALLGALVGMVLQGRSHRLEPEAPLPFSGPRNFLRRWFTEQFVTFPLFLLSGRWWQQYRAASRATDDAA